MVPVVASNRVGREEFPSGSYITFYGTSFIADQTGEIVGECSYDGPGAGARNSVISAKKMKGEGDASLSARKGVDGTGETILHTFDLERIRLQRAGWGLFRDRRPELYTPLLSLDGSVP